MQLKFPACHLANIIVAIPSNLAAEYMLIPPARSPRKLAGTSVHLPTNAEFLVFRVKPYALATLCQTEDALPGSPVLPSLHFVLPATVIDVPLLNRKSPLIAVTLVGQLTVQSPKVIS